MQLSRFVVAYQDVRPGEHVLYSVLTDRYAGIDAATLDAIEKWTRGEGPADADEGTAQQVLREEGVEDHCRLVGFVSPITPFFRAVDVVVHTSDMEILSMSLCESQACGKPTLAYAVGGNPETLPSSWHVAELGDLDTLEEKLAQLVSDADFRRRCGEEAEGRLTERHVPLAGRR